MKLDRARRCADRLVEWLAPHCERVVIAGSVRRGKPEVADLDLVVIPKFEVERDIFGTEIASRNSTWREIDRRITEEKWRVDRAGAEIVTFHAADVQVDVFWASHENWGTVLMCRTGSKDHNIWLANWAMARGGKWHPNVGLYHQHRKTAQTEEAIYEALGLPFIAPERREIHLLPSGGLRWVTSETMSRFARA